MQMKWMISAWILLQTNLIAQTHPYQDLLPTRHVPAAADEDIMRNLLQSCFTFTPNGSLPSGYARLGFERSSQKLSSRVETSTFKNTFLESCLVSKANEFKSPSAHDWTYLHLSASCHEKFASDRYQSTNVQCALEIALTSSKDSSRFMEQVEAHWKSGKQESNENYQNAAGLLYEALRFGR